MDLKEVKFHVFLLHPLTLLEQPMNHQKCAVSATIVVACWCLASLTAYASEILIPRSMPGDKGKYYLIDSKKTGDIVQVLHKRVGVDSVGFTKTETNCKTRQMRELGYGEGSPDNVKTNSTKWFDLVPGSSKNDLAIFVCKW